MKQKGGNLSLSSPSNGAKNNSFVQRQRNSLVKTPAKGTPVKLNQKKAGKTPVKVLAPKSVEEEVEDDSDEEEDSGADVEAGVADEAEDSDADDQEVDEEDQEDDEEDQEDDEEEDVDDENLLDDEAEQDDDDDDDAPVEAPIVKKTSETPPKAPKTKKTKAASEIGVPKIKTGAIPKDFPKDQVLIVRNLPKHYKQIDIVEVFAKYGTLHTIHNNHGPVSSIAYVAYNSPEEAAAARAGTDNVAKVKGITIRVNIQTQTGKAIKIESKKKDFEEKKAAFEEKKRKIEENKSRTVYIKNMKDGTTEDQVKAHFAECGEIESVKIFPRYHHTYGFVCFKDESSASAAANLHNSILNDANLWVLKSDQQNREVVKDPQRTVLLKNNKNLASIDPKKIESIFAKCGEIEDYSLLCKKNVLAFITFVDQKGAKKALKLNGTNAQGLDLEIEEYKLITPKNKTTIFIQNVKPGVTEEEIRELFASTGPIESVNVLNGFATVKFEDIDSFCKAFLLNESYLRGQLIFLEPYSERKQSILRHQKSPFNRKRPAPFNKGGGHSKKIKTN